MTEAGAAEGSGSLQYDLLMGLWDPEPLVYRRQMAELNEVEAAVRDVIARIHSLRPSEEVATPELGARTRDVHKMYVLTERHRALLQSLQWRLDAITAEDAETRRIAAIPVADRLAALEAENVRLRDRLASSSTPSAAALPARVKSLRDRLTAPSSPPPAALPARVPPAMLAMKHSTGSLGCRDEEQPIPNHGPVVRIVRFGGDLERAPASPMLMAMPVRSGMIANGEVAANPRAGIDAMFAAVTNR